MDYELRSRDGDPHHVGLYPTNQGGEDEQHHEKKSVLKKVKEKAKKIKHTITHGHGHEHDQHHEHDPRDTDGDSEDDEEKDEEIVQDPGVHDGQMNAAGAMGSGVSGVNSMQPRSKGMEETEGRSEKGQGLEQPRPGFGEQTDPGSEQGQKAGQHRVGPNYQSKESDPSREGSEEAGITPMLHSFDKLNVSDETKPKPEEEAGEHDENRGKHGEEAERTEPQSSYTQKISSAVSAITEKAASAKNVVASKLSPGMPGSGATSSGEEGEGSDAGQDKGVSVKQYFAEKLRPGDEDRTLSGMISDVFNKRNGNGDDDDEGKWPTMGVGRVTESEEVTASLGTGEEGGRGGGGGDGGEVKMDSGGKGGVVVDWVKGAVESWFKGGQVQQKDPSQGSSGPAASGGTGEDHSQHTGG